VISYDKAQLENVQREKLVSAGVAFQCAAEADAAAVTLVARAEAPARTRARIFLKPHHRHTTWHVLLATCASPISIPLQSIATFLFPVRGRCARC